VFHSWSETL